MQLYKILEKLTDFVNIKILRYEFEVITVYDGSVCEFGTELEDNAYEFLHKNVIKMRVENDALVIIIE